MSLLLKGRNSGGNGCRPCWWGSSLCVLFLSWFCAPGVKPAHDLCLPWLNPGWYRLSEFILQQAFYIRIKSSQQSYEVGMTYYPILQMRSFTPRGMKWITQGHTAHRGTELPFKCSQSDSRISITVSNTSHQILNEYETEWKRHCKEISSALECFRLKKGCVRSSVVSNPLQPHGL